MHETIAWPVKQRETHHAPCVSSRWNDFAFRDDDIVIGTWKKSGTTWTQQIVAQLVFGGDPDVYGQALSPWIDGAPVPVPVAREMAETQMHRRFLKTHLPLDTLVYSPKAKYIYIGRDARDVFWSWHHHWQILTPVAISLIDSVCSPPSPPFIPDIRAAYHDWLDNDCATRDSFWQNVQSWWDYRHLPNMLLLHYANMKDDTEGTVRQIAQFLEIPLTDCLVARVLEHSSVDFMKELASRQPRLDVLFEGGGRSFINKGTNGRWRDVLSAEEVAKCDGIAAERLAPECAHWLRTGELP